MDRARRAWQTMVSMAERHWRIFGRGGSCKEYPGENLTQIPFIRVGLDLNVEKDR